MVPVMIDVAATPRGGALNLFIIYVALSPSGGPRGMRLLGDFDEAVVLHGYYPPGSLQEDDRLERMNKERRNWREKLAEHYT
ncbi:hypothetical protein CPB85DRAFT_434589 [Mucidula mucida]|nr:hypothetical protein CPB85DRAFT_434589 [Mucidula mucida]